MVFTAAGTLASNAATALTTLVHTNNAIGNCLVLGTKLTSTSITVTGVSGGGATGWVSIGGPNNDGNRSQEFWLATVSATGAQTITVTWSLSNAGLLTDLDCQEFSSSLGVSAIWSADTSGWFNDVATKTTTTFPTLAPLKQPTELYIGQSRVAGGGAHSNPLPAGFVLQTDSNSNPFVYGLAVTGSVTPTTTHATASTSASLAALIADTVPYGILPQQAKHRMPAPFFRTGMRRSSAVYSR